MISKNVKTPPCAKAQHLFCTSIPYYVFLRTPNAKILPEGPLPPRKSIFRMKASPGRGKLSPQVTDEGAGQQHFILNTPHPALRATRSPFCRYATFSPGAGEICPQGVKALALGQAAKVDFRALPLCGL